MSFNEHTCFVIIRLCNVYIGTTLFIQPQSHDGTIRAYVNFADISVRLEPLSE